MKLRAMIGYQLWVMNGGERRKKVERAIELQRKGKDLVSMVLSDGLSLRKSIFKNARDAVNHELQIIPQKLERS